MKPVLLCNYFPREAKKVFGAFTNDLVEAPNITKHCKYQSCVTKIQKHFTFFILKVFVLKVHSVAAHNSCS